MKVSTFLSTTTIIKNLLHFKRDLYFQTERMSIIFVKSVLDKSVLDLTNRRVIDENDRRIHQGDESEELS